MKQTELGLIPDDWEVKESNAVARVGSDKTGHWEIVNREKCEKQSQNIRKNVIFNSKNAGKM